MPEPKPKPKKVGRPKLAKGEVKGCLVAVRFNPDELRSFDRAAKASKQKRSEWIRETLNAAAQNQSRRCSL